MRTRRLEPRRSLRLCAKSAGTRQGFWRNSLDMNHLELGNVLSDLCYSPAVTRARPMTQPVVARFAPSPTGFLHIGGGRTALFNWLYARGRGGKMLLRIEDTDRERSTDAAIDAIIDGLKWLGITWDGEIVHQFARAARHREVAEQLLAASKAYRCYASQAELDELREAARR